MLLTAPRRVESLSLVKCSPARRVARHIYEQAVVKGKREFLVLRGISKHLFGIVRLEEAGRGLPPERAI